MVLSSGRSVTAIAPGRVNLIGEHTDYNQGLALPFTTLEGVTVEGVALAEEWIEAVALDLGESDRFALNAVSSAPGWRAFVRGAVGELQRAGVPLRGCLLSFSGRVPRGGGLSSSAALEVALVLALVAVAGGPGLDPLDLAKLCSRIENGWVGAQTGLLDQLASIYGEQDSAMLIDFRSLEVSKVPFDLGGFALVTLDSGEQHSLAASGYNQRRAQCARACELLGVGSLREADLATAERLPEPLVRRVRHVLEENERVERAVGALERGDMSELGRLLDASHRSLRDLYQVSTPRVEAAVERLKQSGAVGARIMGGGFGGHVLGLLAPGGAPPAGARAVSPGPGARVLEAPAS